MISGNLEIRISGHLDLTNILHSKVLNDTHDHGVSIYYLKKATNPRRRGDTPNFWIVHTKVLQV